MDCRQFRDKMLAYLEGEIDQTGRKGFEEHIASCPACSGELEKEKKLTAGLGSIRETVPEGFLQSVRSRIESESTGADKFYSLSYLLRVLVPVAAVLIIALIITLNQPSSRDKSEDAPGGIALKKKSPRKEYFSAYQDEPAAEIVEEKELLQAEERDADDALLGGVMDTVSRSFAKTSKPAAPPAKSEKSVLSDNSASGYVTTDSFVEKKDAATQIMLLSDNPEADILKVEGIARNQRAAVYRKRSDDNSKLGESDRYGELTIDINVSSSNYNALISELEQISKDRKKKPRGRASGLALVLKSDAKPDRLNQKQNIIINIFQIDRNQPVSEENTGQKEPSEAP